MSYQILGRSVKSEYIAISTILSTVGLTMVARSGKKTTPVQQESSTPKFGAQSSEEENFIQTFIKEAEKSESGQH